MKKLLLIPVLFLLVPSVLADQNSDLWDDLFLYNIPNGTSASDASPQNNIPTVTLGSPVYDGSTGFCGGKSSIFTSDKIEWAEGGDFDTSINKTIGFWFCDTMSARTTLGLVNRDAGSGGVTGEVDWYYRTDNDAMIFSYFYSNGNSVNAISGPENLELTSECNLLIARINVTGTNICVSTFINTTEQATSCNSGTAYAVPSVAYTLGATVDDGDPMGNNEVAGSFISNRSWNNEDIEFYWNSGVCVELGPVAPPDTTPPGINITSPINSTTYTVNFVDLNWTVNESVVWCAYSLDGGENTSLCIPDAYNVTGEGDWSATQWGIINTFNISAQMTGTNARGITTNGSDFWVLREGAGPILIHYTSNFIYLDNISLAPLNTTIPSAVMINQTNNEITFWLTQSGAGLEIHRINSIGSYMDTIHPTTGSDDVHGIISNKSSGVIDDLWILQGTSEVIRRISPSGTSISTCTTVSLPGNPSGGLTTNNSETTLDNFFHIRTDNLLYHTGYPIGGGVCPNRGNLNLTEAGIPSPIALTTKIKNSKADKFFILSTAGFVYEIEMIDIEGRNITLTSLSDGLHNVTIWANDSSGNMGQSLYTYWTVDVAVDSCTAPGSGDWAVDCADGCVLDSAQIVPGNMYLNGVGTIVLSSVMSFQGTDSVLAIVSGCALDIRSGGKIGGS